MFWIVEQPRLVVFFFFQAEDGIRDSSVTGVQTCALPISNAPNGPALRTLGRRLAYFNNYRPVQWIGMYAADGTNTDTVYGVSGAPSYTIELGQEFFEDCSTFESSTYPQNFNALKYAARNLMNPYTSPGGPDTTSVGASAKSVERGQAF